MYVRKEILVLFLTNAVFWNVGCIFGHNEEMVGGREKSCNRKCAVRLAVKAELLILVASKIHFGVFSSDFCSFFIPNCIIGHQSEILYNASCKRAWK